MLSEIYNKLFENRKLLYLKGVFFRYIYLRLEAGQEPIMLITVNNIIDICIENNKIVIKIFPYMLSPEHFEQIDPNGIKQCTIDIDKNCLENLINLLSTIDSVYQHYNENIKYAQNDPYIYIEELFPIEDIEKQRDIAEMLKKVYYNDERRRNYSFNGGNRFEKKIGYNNSVAFILDEYINEVVEMRLCNDYSGKTDKYGIYLGESIFEIEKKCNLIKINENHYEIDGINNLYLLIFDNKVKEIDIYLYSKYRRVEEKFQLIKDRYNKTIDINDKYLYDLRKYVEENIYGKQIMLDGSIGDLRVGKQHYEYLAFFVNSEYSEYADNYLIRNAKGDYRTYKIVGKYIDKNLELTKTEDIFGISFISKVKENRIVGIVLGKDFIGNIENTEIGIGCKLKDLMKIYGKKVKKVDRYNYQLEKLLLSIDKKKNILEITLCE